MERAGAGRAFLGGGFGGFLYKPGGLLDGTKYYIVMPDDVGHGKSSKPSDGMHQKFPKYTYEDMVRLEYKLVTEGLGVNHMRLVMGTSMGAMHTWLWGYMYPDFMDALMPLASAPVEIAGRNRMLRKMVMDSITKDPEFKGGEYTDKHLKGMMPAEFALFMMTSSPLQLLKQDPTREKADASFEQRFYGPAADRWPDPNDMYYAVQLLSGLQPRAASGGNRGSPLRDELGRRPGESAGVGNSGAGDQTGEAWPLYSDSDQRSDAWARHALDTGDLGQLSG